MTQAPITADQRAELLAAFIEQHGITFGDCVNQFGEDHSNPYVNAAQMQQREGECEIDGATVVSASDDGGAYVMAWIWVTNEEAGIASSEDEEHD